MAEEEVKEETKPKKGGNLLIIILIVLVVLLLGAVGFIGYYVMTKEEAPAAGGAKQEVKQDKKDETGKSFDAKIENLVLNITNAKGKEKLMKLSFSIKSSEPNIQAIIEANNAEVVDTVIGLISARTSEELLTIGGKTLLKEEMLSEINAIVNEAIASNPDAYPDAKKNNVHKLFFTSFVIK